MSQKFIAPNPHQLQAYLLSVTAELQQLEASLLRILDWTEHLRAANTLPEPHADPLEQMYEDLERAIRTRPVPDAAVPGRDSLARPASEASSKAHARLRVVPAAPAFTGVSAAARR